MPFVETLWDGEHSFLDAVAISVALRERGLLPKETGDHWLSASSTRERVTLGCGNNHWLSVLDDGTLRLCSRHRGGHSELARGIDILLYQYPHSIGS